MLCITKCLHFNTAVDCGPLDSPANSRITLTGTVINSRATYSCFPGYELVGDETRLCSANGQWAGLAPFCKGQFSRKCFCDYRQS